MVGPFGLLQPPLDGIKLNDSRPLHFKPNERLRVTFVNDTMMAHPMHLHGMWSDVEGPDGAFQVRKHTVVVQPAQRIAPLHPKAHPDQRFRRRKGARADVIHPDSASADHCPADAPRREN